MLRPFIPLIAGAAFAALCLSPGLGVAADDAPPMDVSGFEDCDPLVPTYCGAPFPSDYYLRDDDSPWSFTGKKVVMGPDTFPKGRGRDAADPIDWETLDGFSPIPQIMAHFPDLDPNVLTSHLDFEESLGETSTTILLDAETGEKVAHWAELDSNTSNDNRRMFLMYPAQRLQNNRRYIVAMRGFTDKFGDPLIPSSAFRALKNGNITQDPTIEGRRDRFEDIFSKLEAAGWERSSLHLAWDFTTVSDRNINRKLVHMRDDALERVGSEGPQYRRLKIEDDYNDEIYRRISGWMRVPLYTDSALPYTNLVLDDSGLPVFQGWGYALFEVLIPRSVAEGGSRGMVLQYGHGLFGQHGEVESGYLRQQANEHGYIMAATDWWGMHWSDVPATMRVLSGNIDEFAILPDRSHQGFINQLLLMRMMITRMVDDDATQPFGVPTIDPDRRAYYGNSEGGILGGVYMALTTDVTRGCVGVHGAPYTVLLNRSKDFDFYEGLMRKSYPDPMDVQWAIGAIQMLWDRAEPSGYIHRITDNPLPNTPSHMLLQQVALQDHQVTNVGGRIYARSVPGTKLMTPYTRYVWGLEQSAGPVTSGSAYTEWDFGEPEAPVENIPPSEETNDTHESTRRAQSAQDQMWHFFNTGEILHFCDGPCDPQ